MTDPDDRGDTPGRTARNPAQLGKRGLWQSAKRIAQRVGRDRVGLVAAGVAFFGLLAIFPTIGALVAIASLIVEPAEILAQLEDVTRPMPPSAREILLGQVREVVGGGTAGLNLAAIGGLLLALYSSSRGVANLIAGLNVAYEEEEARSFFGLAAVTLALTLFLLVAFSLVLGVVAILPALLALFGEASMLADVARLARWPILLVFGALCFSALYRFGPSRRAARWRWLAPGGVLACLLWICVTAGFSWYVQTLGSYAESFGALAGVIVLLLWLWLTAFAVLLGAVVDAELEYQTACDSTIGPDRPMGARGAVKADETAGDA